MRRVALAALLVAVGLLGVIRVARPVADPVIGRRFPPLALAPLPGVALLGDRDLRAGRATVVTLFASWCVPCKADAPALAALRAAGVPVAGIAVRDDPAAAAAFLRATGTRLDNAGADRREAVQAALGTAGIPETFVVDRAGTVRARFRGTLQPADVAAMRAAAG